MISNKVKMLSWLLLNFVWATILGLLLPRTPSFGHPILAATVPFMLYGVFTVAARNTTPKEDKTTAESNEKIRKQISPWVYGAATLAVTLKYIIEALLNESLLRLLVLSVLLGWPWFEIAWRNTAYLGRFWGCQRSFLASIGISAIGISFGVVIYQSKQEQILSLLLILMAISILCVIVISLPKAVKKRIK